MYYLCEECLTEYDEEEAEDAEFRCCGSALKAADEEDEDDDA